MRTILDSINKSSVERQPGDLPAQAGMLENHIANTAPKALSDSALGAGADAIAEVPLDDRNKEEKKQDDAELYNISNFSV